MLTFAARVLAFHCCFWNPGRCWFCLHFRALHLGHWSLFLCPPRKCHRHRSNWRIGWRHHFSSDAGEVIPKPWLCVEYSRAGVFHPIPTRPRQSAHTLPTPSQAGQQYLARLSHLSEYPILSNHCGSLLLRIRHLRPYQLYQFIRSGPRLSRHLLLPNSGRSQRRLIHRAMDPRIHSRQDRPIQHHDPDSNAMSHQHIRALAPGSQLDRFSHPLRPFLWLQQRKQHWPGSCLHRADVQDRRLRQILRDVLYPCQFWVNFATLFRLLLSLS